MIQEWLAAYRILISYFKELISLGLIIFNLIAIIFPVSIYNALITSP